MAKIGLTINLFKAAGGISKLQKPLKVYLKNSNLIYVLSLRTVNIGNRRETFFANHLKHKHKMMYFDRGDFFVDEKYIFEISGKDKSKKQIATIENSYIAADNIEHSFQNKIPLWLFGFLF